MMKKLLGIVALSLLLSTTASADLKNNWNKYVQAYYDGHSKCRSEWSAIGNFKSNPKLLLDIELCALEEDGKALAKYGFPIVCNPATHLHPRVFEAGQKSSRLFLKKLAPDCQL